MSEATGRVFLFLQGPHGSFFRDLARHLAGLGAGVQRIAFNVADVAEWGDAGPLDCYRGADTSYPAWLGRYFAVNRVTDIVLYGDARPEHALAIAAARPRGIRCHCLEEGYLRPHWVTYERGGNNGNSPLCNISLDRMAAALARIGPPPGPPPAPPADGWGSLGAHVWHSLCYHLRLALPSRRFGRYRSRRSLGLASEFGLYFRRMTSLPLRRMAQRAQIGRLLSTGRRYHLALLQVSFDSSIEAYSGYRCAAGFVDDCIAAFARGAPADELLVFKAHPLEDGRDRIGRVIADRAVRHGVARRVWFLDGGGDLARLLDGAHSVVTVNSTAAQPALVRGLPVVALGRAVYARPGLTSDQDLTTFFARPQRPDRGLYGLFRRFLTETSQHCGSFYTRPGIRLLLQSLPGALLAEESAYDRLLEEREVVETRRRKAG